jgi:hypothetical protein
LDGILEDFHESEVSKKGMQNRQRDVYLGKKKTKKKKQQQQQQQLKTKLK